MKLKAAKSNSGLRSTMSGVLMFSLALMLLVFSCPLKKFLTSEATPTSAASTKQNNQPVKYTYQDVDVNSCSVQKKTELSDFTVSKEVKSIPGLSNFHLSCSVFSHTLYFSASAECPVKESDVASAVPLFLRHLQLLI